MSHTCPLEGIRIVDLSRLLPGPLTTLLLSDLGAEVIRVEDPAGSDYLRSMPPLCPDGMGKLFHALNRGKKSVTIDLKSDTGHQQFLDLVTKADVVVENFRPGVMAKLKIAPQTILEQFPHVVVCSISGFGQTGSAASHAGHDLNFVARTGILGAMRTPVPLPIQVGDICGGAWPAVAQILAALLARQKSGMGTCLDISMSHNVAAMMMVRAAGSTDYLQGDVPCYSIYETKDGHYAVAAIEPKFWNELIAVLGLPDLANCGLSTGEEGAGVQSRIAEAFAQKTNAEWQAIFDPLNICVDPVCLTTGPFQSTVALDIGDEETALPIWPLAADLASPKMQRAPYLGEHNAVFLKQRSP